MAERLGEAVLELRTDDSRYLTGVRTARGHAERLERSLVRVSRAADAFGQRLTRIGRSMALAITAPLTAVGTVAVRAFDQQIQAERRLAAAIRAAGDDADTQLKQFKEIASALQRITTVGDETTLKNIQVARSMGLGAQQSARAARNAIALAEAFGINAQSAIRYTAALEQGDTTMLNRYIPTLRNIEDETKRAAEAQRILAGAFDTATAAAQAGLGPARQLGNNLGDLGETIGGDILRFLRPFIDRLNGLVLRLQNVSPEARRTALAIAGIGAAVGPGLIALGLLVRGIGFALVGLVAFGRGVRNIVRAVIAQMALLAGAFASPLFAAVAAATAILATWLLFKNTILATAKAIIAGLEFWLVQQFRNNVERPFLEALNSLIGALPEFVRRTLGIEPIEIPVEIQGDAGDVFAGGFAKAREAAKQEMARIESDFDALIARVKRVLPDGLAELVFGDFKDVGSDVDDAKRKLDELINSLPGSSGALPAGPARALREYAKEAKNVAAQVEDAMTHGFRSAEDALVDFATTGKASFKDFANSVIADMIRIGIRRAILGPLADAVFGAIVRGLSAGGGAGPQFTGTGTTGLLSSGSFRRGGIAGAAAETKRVPAALFAGAPRFRLGGILGPGEVPAILHRGEEVLTRSDPRHRANMGRGGDTYYIDATGADAAGLARLEGLVRQLHGSIERRSVAAIVEARRRNPRLFGVR